MGNASFCQHLVAVSHSSEYRALTREASQKYPTEKFLDVKPVKSGICIHARIHPAALGPSGLLWIFIVVVFPLEPRLSVSVSFLNDTRERRRKEKLGEKEKKLSADFLLVLVFDTVLHLLCSFSQL